jgi:hypothetical protein
MRIRLITALAGTMAATMLLAILAGCGGAPAETLPEPEYAGAATDVTLQGLSENDLEKYTRYGNAAFKAAVTQEILDEAVEKLGGQLGAYQSKEFRYAEEKDGYTIVHYKAQFANGEIGVRMVFDVDQQVAGQWFE